MLTEERYSKILKIVNTNKSASVKQLTEALQTSESTVRRDLASLHAMGKLKKVHGGATALETVFSEQEPEISQKYSLHTQAKERIARFAATLIRANDFIFLDAGSTTERMADYITEEHAVYVTNGVPLAAKLARRGFTVYVPPGRIKARTDAIIGSETVEFLKRYQFTHGFFGTNGISLEDGYTTPDIDEARTKTKALTRCRKAYVLADNSKFGQISPVTFADLDEAVIVTDELMDKQYQSVTRVIEVDRL